MSRLTNRKDQIYEAWVQLVNEGSINEAIVRPVIAESWKRCLTAEINPRAKTPTFDYTRDSEILSKEKNKLLQIALPVMNDLYQLVRGSDFVVILVDEEGFILETIGDEDVLENAKKGILVKERVWLKKLSKWAGRP